MLAMPRVLAHRRQVARVARKREPAYGQAANEGGALIAGQGAYLADAGLVAV